jgi:hypothetical protein
MTFHKEQTVRIGLWLVIQAAFLIFVFPDLGRYESEQQQIQACLVASGFALVSIVIIVPILLRASPVMRAVLLLMLVFPAWILYSVFRIRGIL